MKPAIPTYRLEQIIDQNGSMKDVFYTASKLEALESSLNKPYRSNYYGVGLCISGSASLVCNLDTYTVQPNSIVTISPQVIKQWKNVSEDFETFTIFFTKDFFTKIFAGHHYLEQFHFFDQNAQHVNSFSDAETASILALFEKIKTYIQQQHAYQTEIVASYINILLWEYQTLFEKLHFKNNYQQTRNQQMVNTFKDLLNKHFRKERTVQFYADQLFITAKHLSEVLKQETGKPASEWINELLLLEGKVLLSNPQLQIAEIAEILHFPDASTFGKFFKNHTNISPLQYRKTL